uniref:Uncharacterized protein n=1 Tax=Hemiselmis andersenii TaxID=464988 RepID=A0A6U4UCS5_HEMAN|mmetsp:Transcript_14688/g.33869  ORF Transcript_14688/g.33869 Transcript_14688/m.33869 type:complete len:446 (-) Transcript_14688:56-1393(-)
MILASRGPRVLRMRALMGMAKGVGCPLTNKSGHGGTTRSVSNVSSTTLDFTVDPNYDYTRSTMENYRLPTLDTEYEGPYADIRATLDHEYHGHYEGRRQKIQDTMIADVVMGGSEQENPWLVFTAGPMGAGKSFVIKWMSRAGHFQLPSIVQIDPDCFRSRLPEWEEYLNIDAATAGAKSHRECGYCVEIAQEVALRASKNIWVDGSLRDHEWYRGVIDDIRERYPHYRIGIIYVYASEATVFGRAQRREKLTGRHVPEGELRNSLEATPRAVRALSPKTDFVAWISNEGDDKAAPKFTKMCDDKACWLLPGDDWTGIRNRFAPVEELDCAAMMVERAVTESDVVLFTKSYCSYCAQVKQLFKELQQKVQAFDLDTMERGLEIQVALSGKTGVTTTPQVFVRGDFIGGNSDVFELHEKGSLVPKLKSPKRKCAISAAAAALLGPF